MFKKCHFIGIGGIGMSGLARLVLKQDIPVSGSDIAASAMTEVLGREGATIFIGHQPQHIQPGTTVIYNTDIKHDNPEFMAAKKLQCPMMHRSELLQALMSSSLSLAVAGTHGKTTTSALLTWILQSSGESPSYAIGGIIPQLSSNAGHGSGKYFVAEACESDGSFLSYSPFGAIVTNIDFDHMDFYQNEDALIDSFQAFIKKVQSPEHFFWCLDNPLLHKLQPKGISYGFNEASLLKGSNLQQTGWSLSMDIDFKGKTYRNVQVALTGQHNALNSLAVFGLALSLGIEEHAIRQALATFGGVLRRCEKKGESHGVLFLDDYAHHPTELKTTLNAIRKAIGERRLVAAYQPHRYTRTQDCIGLYKEVFHDADMLFITDIYAARETPIPGISHRVILDEIQEGMAKRCQYVPRQDLAMSISSYLRPHDVFVTLGAGDITLLSGEIQERFKLKAPSKLKLGLVFGGMSVEHDISLISSANIQAAVKSDFYDVETFGISRQGYWHHGEAARKSLTSNQQAEQQEKISAETLKGLLDCDIIFPIIHGTYGEDGTLQGFLDMLSKAYVGCDHRSAAISMDKAITKQLALEAGIAVLPYISFNRHEWDTSTQQLLKTIETELTFPLFVKPVHLGSSIGVRKVATLPELIPAIQNAFRFDTKIIVENGIDHVREIEFSLLGNDDITVFPPGEVYTNGLMHDYDSKYGLNPQKTAAAFAAKAELPKEKISEGMTLARTAYKAIGCTGMARVDTFLDPQGKFWLNEINPIPGFTKYSLYPLMCAANGLSLENLIDRLIILGLHRRRQLDRLELKS